MYLSLSYYYCHDSTKKAKCKGGTEELMLIVEMFDDICSDLFKSPEMTSLSISRPRARTKNQVGEARPHKQLQSRRIRFQGLRLRLLCKVCISKGCTRCIHQISQRQARCQARRCNDRCTCGANRNIVSICKQASRNRIATARCKQEGNPIP